MNRDIGALVRGAITRRAGLSGSALHPKVRLEDALDLTPLELVLIALEIEEVTGVELTVDGGMAHA